LTDNIAILSEMQNNWWQSLRHTSNMMRIKIYVFLRNFVAKEVINEYN